MSEAQERGLAEALSQAEHLARTIRIISDGRLDLQPVFCHPGGRIPPLPANWHAAQTEARIISRDAGHTGKQAD